MKQKRLYLNDYEACQAYEWWLALFQFNGEPCCEHCEILSKKLAKLIGPSAPLLRKLVKNHPYFK